MPAILEDQERVRHACEGETSLMMALAPDTRAARQAAEGGGPEALDADSPRGVAQLSARSRASRQSGVVGDARRATKAKGEKLAAACRDALVAVLRDEEVWVDHGTI